MKIFNFTGQQVHSDISGGGVSKEEVDKLRQKFVDIDDKYSTEARTVTLDLPDSLNLVKKSYTAPTEEELTKQAEDSVKGKYLDQKHDIESNLATKKNTLDDKATNASQSLSKSLKNIGEQFQQDQSDITNTTIDSGIARSSIASGMHQRAEANKEKDIRQAESDNKLVMDSISEQLSLATSNAVQALANLDESKKAEVQGKLDKLLEAVNDELNSVIAYNNTVEHKEQEYQHDKAVKQAEYQQKELDRALDMAKLNKDIGSTAVKEMIYEDKLSAVKQAIKDMSNTQALQLVEDEQIKLSLGDYYNYMVDYIKRR